ncbi:hypothetical protein B5566_02580 [Mycobacterium sp. MHSD3]|nr:hypothetical protein B5566_02580 [Mycobacterium sp. MHSD3]
MGVSGRRLLLLLCGGFGLSAGAGGHVAAHMLVSDLLAVFVEYGSAFGAGCAVDADGAAGAGAGGVVVAAAGGFRFVVVLPGV